MSKVKNFFAAIAAPTKNTAFLIFSILNLISDFASINLVNFSGFSLLCIITIAFAVAYIESAFVSLFKGKARNSIVFIIVAIHNVLIVADYYCWIMFGKILGQEVIDILSETNTEEAYNFAKSYFSPLLLISVVLGLLLFNFLVFGVAKEIRRINVSRICFFAALVGFSIWAYMGYSFIAFRNGMSIPQYHVFTRISYSIYITKLRSERIKNLRNVAKNLESTQDGQRHSYVVVIGESHSIFHSQTYGYKTPNQPRLQQIKDSGELIVFNDVVSAHDHTHGAMMSLFSMDSLSTNFENEPLFPMCFKSAGYKTVLWDNQYLTGGINFLSDEELSHAMFDVRNSERTPYDGDFIKGLKILDGATLYIIHLMGQHYEFASRYPKSFAKFDASLYEGNPHADGVAAYDNATYYNDYVLGEIIDLFKDTDACLIYVSDHGEEVYDVDSYHGHGNAHTHDPKYQLRVPMYILPFPKFKENEPELVERLKGIVDEPIAQDDFCHILLDMAGIRNKWFNEQRSALSPNYLRKHRIVLNSIDIDK